MPTGDDKAPITTIVDKAVKDKLKEEAGKEKRSLSQQVAKIISDWFASNKDEDKP